MVAYAMHGIVQKIGMETRLLYCYWYCLLGMHSTCSYSIESNLPLGALSTPLFS